MRLVIDALGHFPRSGVWELTLACNMRCKHCGSAAGLRRERELTTDEALAVASDLARLGARFLTLSGGEPLLRDDWDRIAARLSAERVRVNLISNGIAVSDRAVARARAAGITNIAVSLDGAGETHDRIRDVPGAFGRALEAYDRIHAGGLPAAAITCINRWNVAELEPIYETLLARGVESWQLQLAEPMGNMERFREDLVPLEAIEGILDFYGRVAREKKIEVTLADNLGYYSPVEMEEAPRFPHNRCSFWAGCFAGCQTIGIRSNGDVTGCLSVRDDRFIEGNVLETPLPEIWRKKGAFAFNREFKKEDLRGECAECEYGEICRGGCASMSIALNGHPHDDPLCVQRLYRRRQAAEAEKRRSGSPAAPSR